jgi:hypothetical protein
LAKRDTCPVTIIVRRPAPPLAGLVSALVYQGRLGGGRRRARLQRPGHLIDEFQDLVSITPAEYLRSRIDGPNHLRA